MRELGARDVRIHLIYCSREKLDSWDKKDRYYVPRVSYRVNVHKSVFILERRLVG